MKTIADLKRAIKVGTQILKHDGMKPKGIGEVRTVNRTQTNGFYMDGSWVDYPKRDMITFDDDNPNMFSVYIGMPHSTERVLVGKYEIVG